MSHLALYLLGLPRLELNGEEVHLGRRKAMALLTYLAMTKRTHSRDELSAFLWPDYDQIQALAYLRRVLSELNKALGETSLLIDRETVRLDHASIWVDVDDFHQHLAVCKMHTHPVTVACGECVPHLEKAVVIYHDDFMKGFSLRDSAAFDEWQTFQVQELHRELAFTLERLVHWQHSQRAFEVAFAYAQRWLALNPLQETTHRSLMLLYRDMGQRSAALQQYQLCVQTLRAELGIAPTEETTTLYEHIRTSAAGQVDPVVTPAMDVPPVLQESMPLHNLPAQLNTFIGREKEIEEILDKLLHPGIRLLTLAGPGGTGKTRLSLAVAAQVLREFPDGVFFISLASIRDPTLVLDVIAQTFGLRNAGDMPLAEIIQRYLMDKRLLLVLDNFEHVVQAAPEVSALLTVLPQLKVLVTSRSLLRVTGEHHYPVLPLNLPDTEAQLNLEQVAQIEAVQLFSDRAAAVDPGFTLNDENAVVIAEICTRLDGLPLAIELAAARTRLLAPAGVLSQLENRLRFLKGGARDLPSRQRTLRDTIEWSFNLLGAEEQVLFRRLAVFAGGCTLQAAEAVCATPGDAASHTEQCLDVLDCLEKLVDQSLVQHSAVGDVPRFTMLETVREYALEKLIESDESAPIQQAHSRFFLELAEKAEPQLDGPDPKLWLGRLNMELDNLRAALNWALKHNIAVGLRLAAALARYWALQARLTEGREWLARLLAQEQASPLQDSSLRAKALYSACILAWCQGDSVAGFALGEESVAICRDLGDQTNLANALWALALSTCSFPDSPRTLPLLEECGNLYKESHNDMGLAKTLKIYGFKLYTRGERTLGLPLINNSYQLALQFGMLDEQAALENILAWIAFVEGDLSGAWSHSEKFARLLQQVGNKLNQPQIHTAFGDLLYQQCEYEKAKTYYQKSLSMYLAMGNTANMAEITGKLGRIAWRQNHLKEAKDRFTESLTLLKGVERRRWKVAICLIGLAQVTDARTQPERVVTLIGAAETLRRKTLIDALSIRNEMDELADVIHPYLDSESFDAAYARGLAMTKEQAIAFALSDDIRQRNSGYI